MEPTDFDWAAELMERRRAQYAAYSPVFWRPATGATDAHAQFMAATAARDGAVALRTAHAFVLAWPDAGRHFVDDFAVEEDQQWSSEGRELLSDVWTAARSSGLRELRVVTARADRPKRELLRGAGMAVGARWWVKELIPVGEASTWGPVTVGGVAAVLMPAPPVYDPGGPVCALGDIDPAHAVAAADEAARLGAVLAIVRREGMPADVPETEPVLEAGGFHNPSELYDGRPT